ncbi:MAG: TonB-dependent receptor domain-containing protein [Pyrinomonadaceae bacterium]
MKTRLISLVAMLVFGALTICAQTSRGTVSGVVADPNGGLIAGAAVTLTNTQTGVERSATSNGEGVYRFDAVDPGTYSLKATASGFGELTKTNIEVKANLTSDVGATMSPAGQNVTVDVTTESGALLQTEAPVRGGNIDEKRITELPFAGRNPVSLALTLPGVSSNRFGFGVGTFSVNGSRGRSNNFLIDGTENNDISVAGQAFQITNPDAVQEVSVQTGNYDAEFGRAGGAVVNTITKAGTNSFHGTLSYLLDSTRDDALTSAESRRPSLSRDPLINPLRDGRGHPAPGTEQWFAGTIGGPIVHNRTFFFGAFQEQRQNSTGTVDLVVPTAAARAQLRTIFPSGASANLDQYFTITQDTGGVASLFNVPLGARAGCAAPCNIQFGTFSRSFGSANRDRQWQVRIDHRLNDNGQLSGRYLYDDAVFPQGSDVNFTGFDAPQTNRYQNFLLTETHIFSPTITNEARIAYNRIKLSFPLGDNPVANSLARINVTNITSLGNASNLPQGRVANNYVFQDTMTYVRGNHTFRFGVDFLQQKSKQFAPFRGRGELTFNASNVAGQNFSAFANFVDNFGGSNGSALRDFGSPAYYPFLFRQAYFAQDRWKVSEALTLTLGLRYENFGNAINSLNTAAFTGLFNVNPVTLAGPYSQPNEVDDDNNNFAPTLGLAYSPSFSSGFLHRLFGEKRSVIRAGYQIGYDSFFNNIASNAASSSPNIVGTSTVSVANAGAPRGLASLTGSFPTAARPLSPLDSQTLAIKNLVNPYYQRWSLGIQREMPFDIIMDLSYVGTKGTKLYINEDLNPLVPAAQRITPPGFTGTTSGRFDNIQGSRLIRTNGGSSIYHSGQLDVRRRFTNGMAITAAYTFSRNIDNASEVFGVGGNNQPQQAAIPSIFGGQARERGVSLFHRLHRASFTYVYDLPVMKSQRGFLGHLLGGFQISGVTTFESGAPLNVTNGQDADGVGGNLDRPDFNPNGQPGTRAIPSTAVAGVTNPCGITTAGQLFHTTAPNATGQCIDPANARYIGLLAGIGRTGNLGRNTLVTPGTNNWNFNILKSTRIGENKRLEFRTEFYNIFNHPQYLQGSVSPFSPGGGTEPAVVSSSLDGRFLNPNTPQSDGGGRVIRYQLKFIF